MQAQLTYCLNEIATPNSVNCENCPTCTWLLRDGLIVMWHTSASVPQVGKIILDKLASTQGCHFGLLIGHADRLLILIFGTH